MAEKFKEGDVVELKSGGPKMTVTGVYVHDRVGCLWFHEAVLGREQFKSSFLKHVEVEDASR